MNELKIFNYNNMEVRTVERDGEPWFVLRDVCEVLDLTTPSRVAERLDPDEVSQTHITDSLGRQQETTIINESGLYNVILRSDKPEAKPFRKWVTSEVLPSIRRNGGYIAGQDNMTPEELMAAALVVANKTIENQKARLASLMEQNSALAVDNQIMRPKADYFDQLVERNTLTNFRETAKQLEVKETAFIRFLLDKKYIYRDKRGKLMPYANKNDGLFEVKECFNEKTQWSGTQTLVTPKGRETFRLLYIGK